jgi:hypothetical protein
MKHKLFYTLGTIVLIMITFATSNAQVLPQAPPQQVPLQTPGPYYATPSWSQKLPSSTRFVILSDWGGAAVLDKETGLVWQRSPSTTKVNMDLAEIACYRLKVGNRMGWRLPTYPELSSLVDTSVQTTPKLPLGHPFINVQSSEDYWTLTFATRILFWGFNFSLGDTASSDTTMLFWCVRGGQGVGYR